MQLAGQSFNKTQHRQRLQTKLSGRSDSSIEFKHCNISAAMLHLGFPYIRAYQPRSNYQALLFNVAEAQVRSKETLDHAALSAVEQPAVAPTQTDFRSVKSDAPKLQHQVSGERGNESLVFQSY